MVIYKWQVTISDTQHTECSIALRVLNHAWAHDEWFINLSCA